MKIKIPVKVRFETTPKKFYPVDFIITFKTEKEWMENKDKSFTLLQEEYMIYNSNKEIEELNKIVIKNK